jgi:hypothetical protein
VISFPALGRMGRLGNQLFQIATTLSVAMEHGESYGFPLRWAYKNVFPFSGCFYEELPAGPLYDCPPYLPYTPIPYEPGLRLNGFFQSEKYFIKNCQRIRAMLTPLSARPNLFSDTASIHVRRGDYLKTPECWPVQTESYYFTAIEFLSSRVSKFFVFSDDPAWCRTVFRGDRFTICSGSEHEDLAKMASCAHHIIANSTFSWWGAWLNPSPSKTVIAPRVWFGPAMTKYTTKDLFPEGWIVL